MIDELFATDINDSRQWILIRGTERPKAIVLFVHGGPGYPLMWYSRAFDGHLLNDFIVVHWDQRAAGKSASEDTPVGTVSIDQIVSDGLVVAEVIHERFPETPLILVGHSWGTIVGSNMAAQRPDAFTAYLSIGTAAAWLLGEQIRYERLVHIAADRGEDETTAQLQRLGPPPYDTADQTVLFGSLIFELVGLTWTVKQLTEAELTEAMTVNNEYSDEELNIAFEAVAKHLDRLGPALNEYVLCDAITKLGLPVYFVEGRFDMTTPIDLARKYFDRLTAPHGKHWIEFKHSAHMPMYEEPHRFRELLLRVVEQL